MEKIPLPGKKSEVPNRKARKPSKYMELLTAVGLATGLSPAIHSALRENKPDPEHQKSKQVLRESAPKKLQPKVTFTPPEAPQEQVTPAKSPIAPVESSVSNRQAETIPTTQEQEKPTYEVVSTRLQHVLAEHTPLEKFVAECDNLESRDKIKIIEDLMKAYTNKPSSDEKTRDRADDARHMQLQGGYWSDADDVHRYHLGAPGLIAVLMQDDVARQYVLNRLTIGAGDAITEELRQGIKYKFQVDVGDIEKAIEKDESLLALSKENKQALLEQLTLRRAWMSELGMQNFKLGGIDRQIKRIEASLK